MYVDAANSTLAATSNADGKRMGFCDVHRLLENDTRPRWVQFCSLCQAWMCDVCRMNPLRRMRAAMKAKVQR